MEKFKKNKIIETSTTSAKTNLCACKLWGKETGFYKKNTWGRSFLVCPLITINFWLCLKGRNFRKNASGLQPGEGKIVLNVSPAGHDKVSRGERHPGWGSTQAVPIQPMIQKESPRENPQIFQSCPSLPRLTRSATAREMAGDWGHSQACGDWDWGNLLIYLWFK